MLDAKQTRWLKLRWFLLAPLFALVGSGISIVVSDHFIVKASAAELPRLTMRVDRMERLQMATFLNGQLMCQQANVKCVSLADVEAGEVPTLIITEKK